MNKVFATLAALPLVAVLAAPAQAMTASATSGIVDDPSAGSLLEDFSVGTDALGTWVSGVGYATSDSTGVHVLPISVGTGNYGFITAEMSGYSLYLDQSATSLGLLWGTIDSYNTIEFWNDGVLVQSFTGSQIAALAGVVDTGSAVAYANFSGAVFDQVRFLTTSNSFEFDNIRVAPTPLPAALGLFGSAIVGMGAFGLRRRRQA